MKQLQSSYITTLTPSEGKALKKGDTYSTGVTAFDVSGWEEVSMAEYEAWKKAQMEDDTPINVKKIPYQEWLKLYNENKNKEVSRNINGKVYTKGIDIFGAIEVEDAPKEKNTKAAEQPKKKTEIEMN